MFVLVISLSFCLGITNRYFSEDILVKYQTKIQWRYFSFLSVVFKPVCWTIGRRLGHFLIVFQPYVPPVETRFWCHNNRYLAPAKCGAETSDQTSHDSVHLEPDALCACWDTWWLDAWRCDVKSDDLRWDLLEIFVLSRPEKILQSHIRYSVYIYIYMETHFELGGILHMNVWPDV